MSSYIGKTILSWSTSKVLWSSIYSFLHILDYSWASNTICNKNLCCI